MYLNDKFKYYINNFSSKFNNQNKKDKYYSYIWISMGKTWKSEFILFSPALAPLAIPVIKESYLAMLDMRLCERLRCFRFGRREKLWGEILLILLPLRVRYLTCEEVPATPWKGEDVKILKMVDFFKQLIHCQSYSFSHSYCQSQFLRKIRSLI